MQKSENDTWDLAASVRATRHEHGTYGRGENTCRRTF